MVKAKFVLFAGMSLQVPSQPVFVIGLYSSVIIDVDQLQRITLTENKRIEQLEAPPDPKAKGPAPKTRRIIRYNTIKPELFDEIENMEAHGSYGSKIETLVRHLLYLQEKEPDAKSIVFSAWADSLHSKSGSPD